METSCASDEVVPDAAIRRSSGAYIPVSARGIKQATKVGGSENTTHDLYLKLYWNLLQPRLYQGFQWALCHCMILRRLTNLCFLAIIRFDETQEYEFVMICRLETSEDCFSLLSELLGVSYLLETTISSIIS